MIGRDCALSQNSNPRPFRSPGLDDCRFGRPAQGLEPIEHRDRLKASRSGFTGQDNHMQGGGREVDRLAQSGMAQRYSPAAADQLRQNYANPVVDDQCDLTGNGD
jgi:hypothetical protein